MRISDWSSDVCSSDLDQNGVDRQLDLLSLSVARLLRRSSCGDYADVAVRQSVKSHATSQKGASMPHLRAVSASSTRRNVVISDCLTPNTARSEEHTSELQSLMRISYAVFCLKKKTIKNKPSKE